MNTAPAARPAFSWKPLPHPTNTGRYCVARRLVDGGTIQHLPGTTLGVSIASFATRALAQSVIDMMS